MFKVNNKDTRTTLMDRTKSLMKKNCDFLQEGV